MELFKEVCIEDGRDVGRSEPDPNPFKLYSITIKPTFKTYKVKIIKDPMLLVSLFTSYCFEKGYIPLNHSIELDSKKVPHLHGTIRVKAIQSPPVLVIKGIHILVKEIYDQQGWEDYINKSIIENAYAFID